MKAKHLWVTGISLVLIVGLGLIAFGVLTSHLETPSYKVIQTDGKIEMREYSPVIYAEITEYGNRIDSLKKGFKELANYIFGDNQSTKTLRETTPAQEEAVKIPMTSPVLHQKQKEKMWEIRFVMPKRYNIQTLPIPNNRSIKFIKAPRTRYATIRFSGRNTDENVGIHEKELMQFIAKEKLQSKGNPIYAFYNPPWTLPFVRRNEIWVRLK